MTFWNKLKAQIKTQQCLWQFSPNSALCAFAETSPQAGNPLAGGGHPATVLLCADNDHRLDLHGAHGKEEAAVRGCVQPQCSGAGWSSAWDGQHAQSPARRKTHLTHWPSTAGRCTGRSGKLLDALNTWAELKHVCSGGDQVLTVSLHFI